MGRKSRIKRLNRENSGSANKKYDFQSTAFQVVLYIGCGLYIGALILTHDTIIAPKQILLAIFAGTLIGAVMSGIILRKYKTPTYIILFSGLLLGGSTSYFTLIATNHSLKSSSTKTLTLPVLKTGNHSSRKSSCKTPYAVVKYDDVEKELKFPCEFEKMISTYTKVKISISKGFWGFPVITGKKLLK